MLSGVDEICRRFFLVRIKKKGYSCEQTTESSFSKCIGFVLSPRRSQLGLGNLWRFPDLAAKYGGGIFPSVYIILAITCAMITEIAIGRTPVIGVYKALDKLFRVPRLARHLFLSSLCCITASSAGWVMNLGYL